jgi:hypothetical protein
MTRRNDDKKVLQHLAASILKMTPDSGGQCRSCLKTAVAMEEKIDRGLRRVSKATDSHLDLSYAKDRQLVPVGVVSLDISSLFVLLKFFPTARQSLNR